MREVVAYLKQKLTIIEKKIPKWFSVTRQNIRFEVATVRYGPNNMLKDM